MEETPKEKDQARAALAEKLMRVACANDGKDVTTLSPYQSAKFFAACLRLIDDNDGTHSTDYEGLYIGAGILLPAILRNEA